MIGAMPSYNRQTRFKHDGRDHHRKRELTNDAFFDALVDIVSKKRGRIPSRRIITNKLRELGYTLHASTVQWHMEYLEFKSKRILRDKDGDLYIPDSRWELTGNVDNSAEEQV